MNRLQVLFLVLLIGFVALVWLGTGRVPKPSVTEPVSPEVQLARFTQPSTSFTQPPPSMPAPAVVQPSPAAPEVSTPPESPSFVGPLNLIVPVAGIRSD